jgi:hypothetical protein
MPIPGANLTCCFVLKVTGDYSFNGKTYKQLGGFEFECDRVGESIAEGAWIREDTIRRIVVKFSGSTEKILYNFSKNVNDTALMLNSNGSLSTYTLMTKDSLLMMDGLYYHRFNYSSGLSMIEGIGSLRGLLTPWPNIFENTFYLLEFYKESPQKQTIYKSTLNCPTQPVAGLHEQQESALKIFPNPAKDHLAISFATDAAKTIEVRNLLGESILKLTDISGREAILYTGNLSNGSYLIVIRSGYETVVRSFQKSSF